MIAGSNANSACVDENGAHRCNPEFRNVAYGKQVEVSNTCGKNGPEKFIRQTGRRSNTGLPRYICDDTKSRLGNHQLKIN